MMPTEERAYQERLERMTAAAIAGICAHPDNGDLPTPNLAREAVRIAVAALREVDQRVGAKVAGHE